MVETVTDRLLDLVEAMNWASVRHTEGVPASEVDYRLEMVHNRIERDLPKIMTVLGPTETLKAIKWATE